MAVLFYKWFFFFGFHFAGHVFPESTKSQLHPFYVSVTEINHNSAEKNLEISCKIFTEDLEACLSKTYNLKIDLVNTKDKLQADRMISDYIRKHLIMKLDGKQITLEYVGFERENEAVWSYFQVNNTAPPKKIEIFNNILYDAFDKQINLIHASVNGNRKSARLNFPDAQVVFDF